MKNFLFFTLSISLIFSLISCENKTASIGNLPASGENAAAASGPLPAGKIDSLVGFKGCETASFSPLSLTSDEFIYQHYIVKLTRKNDQVGEQITVFFRDSAKAEFDLPPVEAGRFYGISRNFLFVDAGTGPDGRELVIFDLEKRTQHFNTPYCGDLQLAQLDRLWFLLPAKENEVEKMPDCPEKEQWTKDGLSVGYGQRCIFNLKQRVLTRKAEWVCVPMQ